MTILRWALLTAMLTCPIAAEAHRAWMLPSATILAGNEPWVTVDAAVSDDLFYFDHNPLKLDGLVVTGPDGQPVTVQNASTSKYRSVFDVALAKPGTYRLAIVSDNLVGRYKINGEEKRWRGKADEIGTKIPKDAQELKITQVVRRLETFVTSGKPNDAALQPTNTGLELKPLTHPTDLFAGSEARFALLLDGKPAPGLKVAMVRGGGRYRNKLGELALTTDAEGVFVFKPEEPGMYWLQATVEDAKPAIKEATQRRVTYSATLEVLPE